MILLTYIDYIDMYFAYDIFAINFTGTTDNKKKYTDW